MLGAVEASARTDGGRLHDLEITGDLIAPFRTIEALQAACSGLRAGAADELRAAVANVLAEPDGFTLGVRDLGALLARVT
jgi:hypothetical protein